ncbi:MAG: OsmC family protein, partial [Methanospirillum sp.]|uniref:OsmC family protein n=1 Tax=Methanospirillum sp. TaxID=45200 RepID=UPI00236AC531
MSENEVQITMTQVDELCFKVTTASDIDFFVEASPGLGGSGNNPSPLAHFLAALGGCTSIKTKLGLKKRGEPCESLSVDIRAKQKENPPQIFESIHLSFTLKGNLDDRKVSETISDVITLSCPVAVM